MAKSQQNRVVLVTRTTQFLADYSNYTFRMPPDASTAVTVQENPSKGLLLDPTQLAALGGGQEVDVGSGVVPYPAVAGSSGLSAVLTSDEVLKNKRK